MSTATTRQQTTAEQPTLPSVKAILSSLLSPSCDCTTVRQLRAACAAQGIDRETFDRRIKGLAQSGTISLHYHDAPHYMGADERDGALAFNGRYAVVVAFRR